MFGRSPDSEKAARRSFRVLQSHQHDPIHNLSLEESLFVHYNPEKNHEETLLLYTNSSAVVIGKHQNPWKECTVDLLFDRGIPLLRRFSGGGSVYHDMGNIVWSFIGPSEGFSQEENLLIIRDAMAMFSGIDTRNFSISSHGDVLCHGYKISGNAIAFKGKKVLHHGTILVNSDTETLGQCLKGLQHFFRLSFEGTSVHSRPASVARLASLGAEPEPVGRTSNDPQAPLGEFLPALQKTLTTLTRRSIPYHEVDVAGALEAPAPLVDEIRARHASVEWQFRRTAPFRIVLGNALPVVSVRKGIASAGRTLSWDIASPTGLAQFKDWLRQQGA